MTPFAQQIRETIMLDGPISVERYMTLCLNHYYAGRDPLGATGDFTTAPEISQIFGELIGLWAAETWRLMGEPGQIHWVELGPGRGTLTADALHAARLVPAFLSALDVHLVETSPVLQQKQDQSLKGYGLSVTWHDNAGSLPGSGPVLVVANEFFDALPVRQYQAAGGQWRERYVGLDEAGGRLRLGLFPSEGVTLALPPEEGAFLEVPLAGVMVMRQIAHRIMRQGGAALVIDYGYCGPRYGDTLQAMHRHGFVDVLDNPGEADLTTHVDFRYLASAAREAGAEVHGLVGQGRFLRLLGIETRASALKLAAPQEAADIDAGVARLTENGPRGMGELFKVMAISSPALPELPGLPHCTTDALSSP